MKKGFRKKTTAQQISRDGSSSRDESGLLDSAGDDLRGRSSPMPGWALPCGLIILGLLLYGRVLDYEFVVWDDGVNLYENPYFLESPLTYLAFFWQNFFHKLYIPLTYNAWAFAADLSLRIFGELRPSVFHGLNVFFHIANVLLVYGLIRAWQPASSRVVSALAAAVFLLHPMQVEPVAWATGFKDVFSATWMLASLLIYLKAGASGRWQDYAAAWLLFGAAVLAKPSHVFLAGVITLLEAWRAGFRWNASAFARVVLFALPALAAVWWTRQAQEVSEGMRAAPLLLRPPVALDALTFYFGKTFFPHPITIDYGRTPVWVLQNPWTWATAAAPIFGFAALWIWNWKRKSPLSSSLLPGVLFWLLALSPSIGLMPFYFQNISTVADRYAYTALVGMCLVWAAVLGRLRPSWATGLGSGIAVILFVMSMVILPKWRDSGSLFRHALEQNPRSWLGHVNYGSYLVEEKKGEGALAYYLEALRLNPTFFGIRVALGQQLLREGKKREALEQFQEAARLDSQNATVRMNLGIALVQNEQTGEAAAEFEKALSLNPEYYEAWINYGQILAQQQRTKEADAAWRKAIQIDSGKGEAYDRLAQMAFEQGRSMDARNFSQQALEREPGLMDAHVRLASFLRAEGRIDEAIDQLRIGLHHHPDSSEILNNLAWYTATKLDATPEELNEAVQWAELLVSQASKKELNFMDTLAVCYAAMGEFERALASLEEAKLLATTSAEKTLLGERERLFRSRKPYRDKVP